MKNKENISSLYFTDVDVRIKIDALLQKIASIGAQVGKDTKKLPEGIEIKNKIKAMYSEIELLDKDFHSVICPKN